MSLYLDASGLVKTLVNEPGSTEVVQEIGRHAMHFTARVSFAEVCAALGKAQRTERLTAAEMEQCLQSFASRWPNLQRVAITEGVARRAGDLAIRFHLRGYDAVQLSSALEIAHVEPLVFAAWDRDLRAAAQVMGLALFPS